MVFKGFKERERPQDYVVLHSASVKGREGTIAQATDLWCGLYRLDSRADIDLNRLAYFALSRGATEGVIFHRR